MKVLIVNTSPTKREGVTNVIFNLLENMKAEDIQFGYVSINTPPMEYIEKLKKVNCKLYVIPRTIRGVYQYVKSLSKAAKNYDVVHVHGNSATLAIDLLAAAKAGVKIRIAHCHNTSCKMVVADKMLRPLFYKLCNSRLACGRDAGKWLYGNRTFDVIQNGVDTAKFQFNKDKRMAIRNSLGWDDKIIVGHVGNFVEAKNHKLIFEIIKSATTVNNNIRLICIGDGRLLPSAKEYIDKIGIKDYVNLIGSINNPEDYMSAMDGIIMPSIHEGLPLTLVEEQANGLPCLVSDVITEEADLTGSLHYLSLNKNADIWSRKLLEIADKREDRTLTSQLNIKLIKKSGYDISSESQKLLNFYRRLI